MQTSNPARVLLVVSLATGLSLLGDSSLYAVLPIRAAEFGIALGAVGVLLSANRIIRIFLNGPIGLLSDRWPRRYIFVPAMFLGAISTGLVAISPGFWLLLIARLLWGVAWAGIWVSGNAIVMDVAPAVKRGKWIGYYHVAFFLGAAAGSIMGGILTDWIGFRQSLVVAAALTLCGAIAAALFLPGSTPARSKQTEKPANPVSRATEREVSQLASAASLLGVNRVVMAGVLASTFGLWLAQQIGDGTVIGNTTIGVATLTGVGLGVSMLIGMVASPTSGALSDRYRTRWGVVSGGLSIGMAGFGLVALGTPAALILGLPLTSVSSGSNQGLSTAIIGDISQKAQYGRRLGILFTVGDVGSAIGPLLAFALLPLIGLSWIYLGSALLLGLVLIVALRWVIKAPEKNAVVA